MPNRKYGKFFPKSSARELNVIYFIDSNKTRSFSISISKIKVIAASFMLVLFVAVSNTYWINSSLEQRDDLRDRLHASLSTIFEYQSRYDHVYELAYPRLQKNAELEISKASKKLETPEEKKDAQVSTTASKEAPSEKPSKSEPVIGEIKVVETNANLNSGWAIEVEDISLHRDKEDLELSFAIRNTKRPSKVEGYLWSVVTVLNADGNKKYIGSPTGLGVNSIGEVEQPQKGSNWYSIRYYKAKNFYFPLPKGSIGDVVEVKIGMQDLSGNKEIVKYTVQKGQLNKAENRLNYDAYYR